VLIEINWELKDISKLKEDSFWSTASKKSLVFINALKTTNKPVALSRLMLSLILEKGSALGKQVVNSSAL